MACVAWSRTRLPPPTHNGGTRPHLVGLDPNATQHACPCHGCPQVDEVKGIMVENIER
jgi:hypothetical protein